jgi:flavin reductase (DIM6/NTAB) family NADH-FMN oxidoreductase RutF
MPVGPDEFRNALSRFPSGVTVVTTRDAEGRDLGLTVSAFCSVSLVPPLVVVSIDRRSEAQRGLRDSGVFGVSVLTEDQEAVSRQFARPGPDKFEGVPTVSGRSGVALVQGALVHLECRVIAAHEAGDHTLFVGEVEVAQGAEGRPLLYHQGAYRRLADLGPAVAPGAAFGYKGPST